MAGRTVIVLATLDTKSEEARFIAERIRMQGEIPCILDTGIRPHANHTATITRSDVLQAAGQTEQSIAAQSRAEAMETMVKGATVLVQAMVADGRASAIMAIGGGQGTWIGCNIMKTLPLGFPKIMLSTAAARTAAIYAGDNDIMMMSSITDISGLNRIFTPILANAVAAACGMAGKPALPAPGTRPLVAMTMFGVTTAGVAACRRHLEAAGYEVAVFHANGFGGRKMESLARDGMFAGVIDYTTTELTDELVGGIASAGPDRLLAAGAQGLPQIVVPGAIDVVNLGDPGKLSPGFASRTIHLHRANSALMRMNLAESRELAAIMAEKLNRSRGVTRVMVPGKGFSALDMAGGPFHLPDANEAFIDELRRRLAQQVGLEIHDLHVNDAAFARKVADAFSAIHKKYTAQVEAN